MQTAIFGKQSNKFFERKRRFSSCSESTESTDDENNFQRINILPKGKKCCDTKQKKYKTELCKNFSETGLCPYKLKCKFAHGVEELNLDKRQVGKYYRTKKCNSFWNQGLCSYGVRCQFCHYQISSDTTQYLTAWRSAVQRDFSQFSFGGSRLFRILEDNQLQFSAF